MAVSLLIKKFDGGHRAYRTSPVLGGALVAQRGAVPLWAIKRGTGFVAACACVVSSLLLQSQVASPPEWDKNPLFLPPSTWYRFLINKPLVIRQRSHIHPSVSA
jgi:hypothetical protein